MYAAGVIVRFANSSAEDFFFPFLFDVDFIAKELARQLPHHKIPKAFFPWPEECEEPRSKLNQQTFIRLARERMRHS